MTLGPIDPLPNKDPYQIDPIDETPPELLSDAELEFAEERATDSIRWEELTEKEQDRLLDQISDE